MTERRVMRAYRAIILTLAKLVQNSETDEQHLLNGFLLRTFDKFYRNDSEIR